MQIMLLTVLALAGADPQPVAPVVKPGTYYHLSDSATCDSATCAAGTCAGGTCEQQGEVARWEARRAAKQARHVAQAAEHQRRHMMPQTCYAPRYGCYYGGDRHMHRYPAFHGTFYRRPTNYRSLFDYPWHAEPHEPTSLFSYNVDTVPGVVSVPGENRAASGGEEVVPAPPTTISPLE